MGLVSLQFHIKFDAFFEIFNLQDSHLDNWKLICEFTKLVNSISVDKQVPKGDPNEQGRLMESWPWDIPPAAPQGSIHQVDTFCQHGDDNESIIIDLLVDKSKISSPHPIRWSAWHKPSQLLQEGMKLRGLVVL